MPMESEAEDLRPKGMEFAGLAHLILAEWLPGYHTINGREWRAVRHEFGWRLEDPNSDEYWDFGEFTISNYRF